jgi:hypothetical protein
LTRGPQAAPRATDRGVHPRTLRIPAGNPADCLKVFSIWRAISRSAERGSTSTDEKLRFSLPGASTTPEAACALDRENTLGLAPAMRAKIFPYQFSQSQIASSISARSLLADLQSKKSNRGRNFFW